MRARFLPVPVVALVASVALVLGLALIGAAPVGAQSPPTVTSAPAIEENGPARVTPDIIPDPNTGQRPDSPGDRGGSQQVLLFYVICGAILVVGGLAFLDGRRNKRRAARSRATADPAPATAGGSSRR